MREERAYKVGDGTCKSRSLVCLDCGITFISNRPRSKYCSTTCRNHYWNKQQPRKEIYEQCVICGEKFYKYTGSKITCSKECSLILSRRNKNNKEKELRKQNSSYRILYLLRSRLSSFVKKKLNLLKN